MCFCFVCRMHRCTDGIVFVLDSVDVERMEEAKMELMRTAKCPDNQVRTHTIWQSICVDIVQKNTFLDCNRLLKKQFLYVW